MTFMIWQMIPIALAFFLLVLVLVIIYIINNIMSILTYFIYVK